MAKQPDPKPAADKDAHIKDKYPEPNNLGLAKGDDFMSMFVKLNYRIIELEKRIEALENK